MFCIYLRTNSDLCHLQHKLIGFYNRDESVYSAVRTGSLNRAVWASSVEGQAIFVFCIYLRTNSDLCHLQHKLTGFCNRDESVYSAVRTGSLSTAVCSSSLKG